MNATWKRVAVIIAVFIPVAVIGTFVMKQDGDDAVVTNSNTPAATTPATTPPATSTGTDAGTTAGTTTAAPTTTTSYMNGTYSAVGQYITPEGQQSITVTLTVDNDLVTSATVVGAATAEASKMWQSKFVSGVQAQVVGKKLASLHLTNVSGSSLTPIGFNSAVSDIQNQAKS